MLRWYVNVHQCTPMGNPYFSPYITWVIMDYPQESHKKTPTKYHLRYILLHCYVWGFHPWTHPVPLTEAMPDLFVPTRLDLLLSGGGYHCRRFLDAGSSGRWRTVERSDLELPLQRSSILNLNLDLFSRWVFLQTLPDSTMVNLTETPQISEKNHHLGCKSKLQGDDARCFFLLRKSSMRNRRFLRQFGRSLRDVILLGVLNWEKWSKNKRYSKVCQEHIVSFWRHKNKIIFIKGMEVAKNPDRNQYKVIAFVLCRLFFKDV